MPAFSDPSFFGNSSPVMIEYCAGNGLWIAERARAFPEINWIAVEYDFERVRKIWSKIQNFHLSNLIVVSGEALTFTRYYLKSDTIDGIYVNFPDPWPKQKHAKNRLFQSPFVAEIARIMKNAAKAVLVTDDADYGNQMHREMCANPYWENSFSETEFLTDWPNYGTSFFDHLWREKGKTIRYYQFENVK